MSCSVPVVVAQQSFLNQTSSLAITAIYTPDEEGFYLVQMCVTISAFSGGSGGGSATPEITSTDPVGSEFFEGTGALSGSGSPALGVSSQGTVYSVASEPINLAVSFGSADPTQTYSAYITITKMI